MVLEEGDIMRLGLEEEVQCNLLALDKQAGARRKNLEADVNRMNDIIRRENIDSAIIEVYSPPRVDAIFRMSGLLPLDLTTNDPIDGKPLDFSTQDKRDRAEQIVRDKRCDASYRITHVQRVQPAANI